MGKTRITIVRHGETEWNKSMQLQGHQDSPLTTNGLEQAELLAETINKRQFELIITSDLGRAKKTASILNKHMQLKVVEDKSLRERAFGVMEGMKREIAQEKYPELWQAYITRNKDFTVAQGESLVQFNERVIESLNNIANSFIGKHILIIAHGGILDCILRKIFNVELDEKRSFIIPNTSVNTFTIEENSWILEEWGNVEHLNSAEVLDEIN
jgi:2,3-bisphosphoglycerate-dependent phosphoglycerate mutase